MLENFLLIKDIIELIHQYRKKVLKLLLTVLVILILFFGWVSKIVSKEETRDIETWTIIEPGDSIFVKDNVFYLDFYKKGREKLSDYNQKEINYRREDTINFIQQNSVHEKYFYKKRTSFVGICKEKDSTITVQGEYNNHRWVKIKPSYEISHPPKSNKYDYDARKWYDNKDSYFVNGHLSKDFFVDFEDITNINNDSIFNR
ncbi:MAG: hypothetical protein GQ564_08570 [Bacteroidales bacterium]|nr:hypothetical protein [Bacteroidales bacterium]